MMEGQAPAWHVPLSDRGLKSYQWLGKSGLRESTETLIMLAQEQALNMGSMEAGIYNTTQDPRCRLCNDAPETEQQGERSKLIATSGRRNKRSMRA